ncbi:hypothetical protein SDC9_198159 [bioreactor metagenome]|uniref:Uncharacterized protein n=1 Tax=bioreactor metagenome TaxID=1076179 RepID=A0A645II70_9ZZZZ
MCSALMAARATRGNRAPKRSFSENRAARPRFCWLRSRMPQPTKLSPWHRFCGFRMMMCAICFSLHGASARFRRTSTDSVSPGHGRRPFGTRDSRWTRRFRPMPRNSFATCEWSPPPRSRCSVKPSPSRKSRTSADSSAITCSKNSTPRNWWTAWSTTMKTSNNAGKPSGSRSNN